MAEGGEVLSLCATGGMHQPDCEYYAEGGPIIPADQVLSDAPGSIVPDSEVTPDSESGIEQTKSFFEGAGKGVAGPIAPAVERAFGVKPEDMLRREKDFPITHAAGETAGFVGSSFIPGGQAKVLAKVGKAASEAAGLGKASTFGAKVASEAVDQAVQMALLGGSNEVSKMIVNDPDQSAQSAIANIGLSAALGGVGGAAIGSISPLWEATVGKKVGPILEQMKGRLDYVKNGGAAAEEAALAAGTKAEKPLAEALIHEKVPHEEFHKTIGKVLENKDPMYKANITPYAAEEYTGMKTYLSPDKKSGYAIKPDGELVSVFSLEKGRGERLVDDAVWNKKASKLDAFDINGKLPNLYGKHMDETARLKFADEYAPKDWDYKTLGRPDVVQMQFNEAKSHAARPVGYPNGHIAESPGAKVIDALVATELHKIAGKGIGGAIGTGVGHALGSEALGALTGTYALGPVISDALKPLLKPLMDKAISPAGMKSALEYATMVAKGAKAMGDATGSVFKSGASKISIPSQASLDKMDKVVDHYTKNPDQLGKVSNGELSHYMPDQQAMLTKATTQALQYLQQIKPHPFKPGPLDKEIPPTDAEMARYQRALTIAQNPLVVMEHVKNGSLLPTDMQDLRGMYPGVYGQLASKLSNAMMTQEADGELIPHKTKIALSMFLGQPIDSSMTPQSILMAQPLPKPPPQAPGAPKRKGTSSLGKDNSTYQTMSQSAEADRHGRRK